jgi:hypothetical protein
VDNLVKRKTRRLHSGKGASPEAPERPTFAIGRPRKGGMLNPHRGFPRRDKHHRLGAILRYEACLPDLPDRRSPKSHWEGAGKGFVHPGDHTSPGNSFLRLWPFQELISFREVVPKCVCPLAANRAAVRLLELTATPGKPGSSGSAPAQNTLLTFLNLPSSSCEETDDTTEVAHVAVAPTSPLPGSLQQR